MMWIICCFTLISLASVNCHHPHHDHEHQHVHDHFHGILGQLLQSGTQHQQNVQVQQEEPIPKSDITYGPSIISLTKYNRKVHGPTLFNPDAGRFIHLEDYPNFSVTVPLAPDSPDETSNNVFISRHLSGPGQFQVVAPEGHGVMAVIQSMDLRTAKTGCHDFIQFGDYDSGVETRGSCGKVEKRDGSVTPSSLLGPRVFVAPSGRMKVLFYHGFVWGLVRDFNFDLLDPSRNPMLRVELVFTAYKECDSVSDPDQAAYKSCISNSGPGHRTCVRSQLFCDSVINCGFEENFGFDEGVSNCLQTSLLNLLLPRVLSAASTNPNLFWALANANRFTVGHEEEELRVPEVESSSVLEGETETEKVGPGEIASIPILTSTEAPAEIPSLTFPTDPAPAIEVTASPTIISTTELEDSSTTNTRSTEVTTQVSPESVTHDLESGTVPPTPTTTTSTTTTEATSSTIPTTTTERTTPSTSTTTLTTTTESTTARTSISTTAKPYKEIPATNREAKSFAPPRRFTVLSEANRRNLDKGPFRVQLHQHLFNISRPRERPSASSTLKEVTERPLIGQSPSEKELLNKSQFIQPHAVSETSRDYVNNTNPLIQQNKTNTITPTKSSSSNMTLGKDNILFAEEGEGQTEQLHTDLFDVTEIASYPNPTGSSHELDSSETDLNQEDNESSITLWVMLTILLAIAVLLIIRIYLWNHRVIWVPNPKALRARRKKRESSVYVNANSPSGSPRFPGLHKPPQEGEEEKEGKVQGVQKTKETPPSYDILFPTQNSLADADMLP